MRKSRKKHSNFTGRVKREVAPWNRFTGDVPSSRANWGGVGPAPVAAPSNGNGIGMTVPSGFPGLGATPQLPIQTNGGIRVQTAGFGGYVVGLASVAALFFVIGYSLELGQTS